MLNDFRQGKLSFDVPSTSGKRQKVINFGRSLLGHKDAITVDARVMEVTGFARVHLHNGSTHTVSPSKKEYDVISRYVNVLAKLSGYEPRQIISMLWAGKKKLNVRHQTVNTKRTLEAALLVA
jgi:hypothetical protein